MVYSGLIEALEGFAESVEEIYKPWPSGSKKLAGRSIAGTKARRRSSGYSSGSKQYLRPIGHFLG